MSVTLHGPSTTRQGGATRRDSAAERSGTGQLTRPGGTEPIVVDLSRRPALLPGTHVEVRCRFDRSWCRGFEIAGVSDSGYTLRRLTDGDILPVAFALEDVRPASLAPA